MEAVRAWTESLWGRQTDRPDRIAHAGFRTVEGAPTRLARPDRVPVRIPNGAERKALIARWGHACAFCAMPLIRGEVRTAMRRHYPDALRWGDTNQTQHAGFQCFSLQHDHLLPHSHGGGNGIDNVAITCAPCNYGRGDDTLEERGLIDPRTRPVKRNSGWDGLKWYLRHNRPH